MYIRGIWPVSCVEKNSEMEPEHRKYKGRVVFLGNSVVDQHHDEATFRDMGSTPATLEAAKEADFYGCLPGHVIKLVVASRRTSRPR